ncbi:Hypothetical protein PBC10988_37190 [Planctomycetales bacterium 10988]|nr:Hypothetical protein PBC10988_37190 [Planctomycetales bacterium 10988]
MHALDFLKRKRLSSQTPVYGMIGDEAFLQREALQRIRELTLPDAEDEFSRTVFQGAQLDWLDLQDELSTRGLFGDSRKLVEVENADDAIKTYRSHFEKYLDNPSTAGVLVLLFKTLPKSTRLYKGIDRHGIIIECKAPSVKKLHGWLIEQAQEKYQKRISAEAAEAFIERIGNELGLLDQELQKLSSIAGEEPELSTELVLEEAGGWRTKSAWELLDKVLDGQSSEALEILDRLLAAGDHPIAILAQVAATLRKLAAATQLILDSESQSQRMAVRQALLEAGVKPFAMQKTERQLRRLGRHRGQQLHGWLLQADMDLKGDSPLPPRVVLEQFLLRLANATMIPR